MTLKANPFDPWERVKDPPQRFNTDTGKMEAVRGPQLTSIHAKFQRICSHGRIQWQCPAEKCRLDSLEAYEKYVKARHAAKAQAPMPVTNPFSPIKARSGHAPTGRS